MRTAIEEEQLSLVLASLASASMDLGSTRLRAVAPRTQPTAEGLIGDDDSVVVVEGIGQVGEVVIAVDVGGCLKDPILQDGAGLVVGRSPRVAVADAGRAFASDLGLEALDLPKGHAQGLGRMLIGSEAVHGRLKDLVALRLPDSQGQLLIVHSTPPFVEADYRSGVTESLWRKGVT